MTQQKAQPRPLTEQQKRDLAAVKMAPPEPKTKSKKPRALFVIDGAYIKIGHHDREHTMGNKKAIAPAKSLKKQREECLEFLYVNAADIRTWLDSALSRYRGKRVLLDHVVADIDGAETNARCTIREAKEKWPDLFKVKTFD